MDDELLPFGKDQTIFSELLYLHSPVQCAMDPAFAMYEGDDKLPKPETVTSRQVLCIINPYTHYFIIF